jgi:hypothetical protein
VWLTSVIISLFPIEDEKGLIDHEIVSSGMIKGLQNIRKENAGAPNEHIVITLRDDINYKISCKSCHFVCFFLTIFDYSEIFRRVVEFWYTGITSISGKSDFVPETMHLADMFECEELSTICRNVLEDNSELNPSIGMDTTRNWQMITLVALQGRG